MAKRSYFEEISEIETTWELLSNKLPTIPVGLDPKWLSGSAYCIGSGGSLSLAKMWQSIHESCGLGFAKALTPYEFNFSSTTPDVVVLFSASGKNHDILQVFRSAIEKDCRILVFTVSQKSALLNMVNTYPEHAYAINPSVKVVKDGFLAVNSIIAITCLMKQLKNHLFGNMLEALAPVKLAKEHHAKNQYKNYSVSESTTIQIISSEWGAPAGIDMEARLAESGVCPAFVTDPRNFGHGRFLWLEERKSTTMVIVFNTTNSRSFIQRFNKKLPTEIPCYLIDAPYEGIDGAIYCIVRSILLFGEFASQRNIDPGKPTVPLWGRKLHTLRLNNQNTRKLPKSYPALTADFSTIVMDMDGTLLDTKDRFKDIRNDIVEELTRLLGLGLKIYFATGRGSSALTLLKQQIPECFHENIVLGLYNGTALVRLSEKEIKHANNAWPSQKKITSIVNSMNLADIKIDARPTQISLRGLSQNQIDQVLKVITNELEQHSRFVKYKLTGHSLDILPTWATKLSVVELAAENNNSNILCIGDQGQVGGNDEELLNWTPSISVGKSKPSSNLCLWIGKDRRYRESNGTAIILSSVKKEGATFKLNLPPAED